MGGFNMALNIKGFFNKGDDEELENENTDEVEEVGEVKRTDNEKTVICRNDFAIRGLRDTAGQGLQLRRDDLLAQADRF